MRIQPVHPDNMNKETRYVHEEVVKLITRSQGPVVMTDSEGALTGPFPPMLTFPQFGIPALSFIRSLDTHATLPKKVREVAILSVGASTGARFELYAHEIMAAYVGFSKTEVASLAAGIAPSGLNNNEMIAYQVTSVLMQGHVLPASTYAEAVRLLGNDGTAELIFLIGAYSLLATLLNGFDVPAPELGSL